MRVWAFWVLGLPFLWGAISTFIALYAVEINIANGAASSTYLCSFDCGIGLGGVIAGYLLRFLSYSQIFAIMLLFIFAAFIIYYGWARNGR